MSHYLLLHPLHRRWQGNRGLLKAIPITQKVISAVYQGERKRTNTCVIQVLCCFLSMNLYIDIIKHLLDVVYQLAQEFQSMHSTQEERPLFPATHSLQIKRP